MAETTGYFLSSGQVARLSELLVAYERGELRGGLMQGRHRRDMEEIEFGKASATISGVTALGADPSSGTVNLWTFGSTGNTTTVGRSVTAYNFSTVAVTTTQWLQLQRHRTGNYMIVGALENQQYKPYVRYQITTAITTGTSAASVRITDFYGLGLSGSTTMTIQNLPTSGTGFVMAGSTSNRGIAVTQGSSDCWWVQGECT